jgi:uncharacterized membrane protein
MTEIRRVFGIFAAILFAGLGVLGMSRTAEAIPVTLDNYRDKKISVALLYYDVNEGSWCCQGWWIVDASGERTINVPHHPKKRIYYYVESGGKVVHKRSEGWARRNVVSNAFKYYEHDGCPDGKNFRTVYFNCSAKVTGDSWKLNIN